MKYTNAEIETRLKNMLYDMLSDYNQESAILNLVYDDYIGFDGY